MNRHDIPIVRLLYPHHKMNAWITLGEISALHAKTIKCRGENLFIIELGV